MASPFVSNPKDVELEATIHRAIRNMGVGMHVRIKGGRVIVSGYVEDYADKRDVISVVRSIAGVHEITNYLKTAPVGD